MAQVHAVRGRPALTRAGIRSLVAAAALAVALAAPTGAAAVPPPPTPEFYGVTAAETPEPVEYQRMAAGGVRTVRLPLYWPHIEPDPPQPPPSVPGAPVGVPEDQTRWGPVDRIIKRAASQGVRVMPFIYGTPDWVSGGDELRPPLESAEGRSAWQDFVGDLVNRYGPGGDMWDDVTIVGDQVPVVPIIDWQIGNEPNSPVFWSPRPRPNEYAEVVALASAAIHAADPNANVVLAGMFGAPTNGVHAWEFLSRFHAGGRATGTYDTYALPPYAPELRGITRQVEKLRREIDAGPAPASPLWITEIGWPTDGPPEFNMVKTEQGQKRLLARSFRLFASRPGWNIGKVVWYVWRDNGVQPGCTVCSYSGLFTRENQPKPAWRKLTQFAGGVP